MGRKWFDYEKGTQGILEYWTFSILTKPVDMIHGPPQRIELYRISDTHTQTHTHNLV